LDESLKGIFMKLSKVYPEQLRGHEWILGEDTVNLLSEVAHRAGMQATHFLGYTYVDDHEGVTIDVYAFCALEPEGEIVPGERLQALDIGLKIPYTDMAKLRLFRLPRGKVAALGLPEFPEWLQNRVRPAVESLRGLPLLESLRAPGYPDRIRFAVMPARHPNDSVEMVWGRLENELNIPKKVRFATQERYFLCTLMEEPGIECGVHAGDPVIVQVVELAQGISPMFVGKYLG
jgi:hypothetical protein